MPYTVKSITVYIMLHIAYDLSGENLYSSYDQGHEKD
jgi:type III secretory pathway component EscS